MKASILLTVAASLTSLIFAQAPADEAGKLDTTCKPCQERCPQATALQSASILINDFLESVDADNLVLIQALKSKQATIRTNLRNAENVCVASGDVDLLLGLIPLIPVTTVTLPASIDNAYVDAKGRVIAYSLFDTVISSLPVSVQGRFVLEPVLNTCEFKLAEFSVSDVTCL